MQFSFCAQKCFVYFSHEKSAKKKKNSSSEKQGESGDVNFKATTKFTSIIKHTNTICTQHFRNDFFRLFCLRFFSFLCFEWQLKTGALHSEHDGFLLLLLCIAILFFAMRKRV
jgi:hypothetical protein